MIQWIRLCTSTAGVRVQSLFRELRSHMPCSVARPPLPKKKGGEQSLLITAGSITESVQRMLPSHAFTHAPLAVPRFFPKVRSKVQFMEVLCDHDFICLS